MGVSSDRAAGAGPSGSARRRVGALPRDPPGAGAAALAGTLCVERLDFPKTVVGPQLGARLRDAILRCTKGLVLARNINHSD